MGLMNVTLKDLLYNYIYLTTGIHTIRWLSVLQYFLSLLIDNRPDLLSQTNHIFFFNKATHSAFGSRENSSCGKCWPQTLNMKFLRIWSLTFGLSFYVSITRYVLSFQRELTILNLFKELLGCIPPRGCLVCIVTTYMCVLPQNICAHCLLCVPWPSCTPLHPVSALLHRHPQTQPSSYRLGYLPQEIHISLDFRYKSVSVTSGQYPCHHTA